MKKHLLIFLALMLIPLSSTSAQDGGMDKKELRCEPKCDEIESRAQGKKDIRLIVRLRTKDPKTELGLSKEEVNDRRDKISKSLDKFLGSLNDEDVIWFEKMEIFPDIHIRVTSEGLKKILKNPDVEVIWNSDGIGASPMLWQSIPFIHGYDPSDQFANSVGTGQVIAMLDTGVEAMHPFLGKVNNPKVIEEACYSTTDPTRGVHSLCRNGVAADVGPGSGGPCSDLPDCNHGTLVAGVIAGMGQDPARSGATFRGVAPGARIMSVKVFSAIISGSNVGSLHGDELDIIRGFQRIILRKDSLTYGGIPLKLAAVNLSLAYIGSNGLYMASVGPCDNHPLKIYIDELRNFNIPTIIASGNGGYTNALGVPACISTAISVGATSKTSNFVASYSNSSQYLSLLAPGGISDPPYTNGIYSSTINGAFDYASGTSLAAPHVAGAIAILKQQEPNASIDDVIHTLQNTGVTITDSRNFITKSRISIIEARNKFGYYIKLPVYLSIITDWILF